ncbi:DASH complex subunit Duo1-domain-containing protein, partial [Phyllosticta paracitricarpa]
NMADNALSDSEIDFDTPAPAARKSKVALADPHASPSASPDQPRHQRTESRYTTHEAREAALKRELDQVRSVNKVIEGVVESLEKARSNMNTVHHTVNSASTLLHTWTRILSATEHNQRLILSPNWQGASQDVADIEADELAARQAAERREREEVVRREAALRKAEEDERRRAEAAARPTSATGTRGRRGGLRGRAGASSTSSSGRPTSTYVGVGGQGGVRGTARQTAASRAGSGIGRGLRGRGRG